MPKNPPQNRPRHGPFSFPRGRIAPRMRKHGNSTFTRHGKRIFVGCKMLQEPIQKLLAESQPRPSCIISTNSLPWTGKVASNLGIPRYAFQTIACFSLLMSHNVGRMTLVQTAISDTEPFVLQGMPDKIVLTKSQIPQIVTRTGEEDRKGIIDQMIEAERLTRGMVVNSFEEMEPKYVEAFKNMGKKIWCIGPVSLCNKEMSDKLERGGNKDSIDQSLCLKWLDSMESNSVIYACFGSMGIIPSSQIIETGLGLEASNCPFIWIIRKRDLSAKVEKWLEDENFEERVKRERPNYPRMGAPSFDIIPSIGRGIYNALRVEFDTGGSVCRVPMITWPMFSEQFYNEKLVVNVLKIGVRVGVEVAMKTEEEDKVYVRREQVKEAIEQLMDEEEKGERIKRAKELSEMATKATEEGGSSFLNITMLIQDIIEQITGQ